MSNDCKPVLARWVLAAATAAGLGADPLALSAQVPPQSAQRTTPPAAPSQESAVQRELRRLYAESGREMPTVPPYVQTKASHLPQPTYSTATPAAGSPSTHPASSAQPQVPAASAPSTKRPNPVVSFFKKLVPGGQSKPEVPQTAATPPRASAPSGTVPRTSPPQYAPYSAQPPRRLPPAATMSAAPVVPAPPSERLGLVPKRTASTPVEQFTEVVPPAVPDPVLPPSDHNPTATAQTQAPLPDEPRLILPPVETGAPAGAPRFEAPLVVKNDTPSVFRIEDHPAEASASSNGRPATDGDLATGPDLFPDPFTELSEAEADRRHTAVIEPELEELAQQDTPSKAATTAQPPSVKQSPTHADPFEEPLLIPPSAATLPAQEVTVSDDLPLLPPPFAPEAENPGTVHSSPLVAPAPQSLPATPSPLATKPAPPMAPAPPSTGNRTYDDKMAKIRERGGMKGLKGFCPVTLRDERELKDALPDFHASYRGQKFHFASAEAKAKFEENPARYAPAAYGADVVVLIRDRDVIEGTLDYAAWYKGRLYLFASEETHALFTDDPSRYATPDGLE